MNYSPEERAQMIQSMRDVCHSFYLQAIRTNVHPFIEFCGLMSKYIDVCERASKTGIDFTETSVHTGNPLPVEDHDVEYFAEKFSCIFASTMFAQPEMWRQFKRAVDVELGTEPPLDRAEFGVEP